MNASRTLLALLLSAVAASGCGDRSTEKKAATQVAARVNNGEISVHQLNFVLQRAPAMPADQAEVAKRRILEGLIDQELAVQQAIEQKLDRTPAVMQLIETSRREILARAYLEQAGSGGAKPSATDIRKYYVDHPELFAQRKIYRLEEASFPGTPETLASVREQIARGKSLADIVTTLKASGVAVGGGVSIKPAEQITLEILPKLAKAKEGQPQLIAEGEHAAIVTVLASKADPFDEAKALPLIENYLSNKDKAERASEALKQLRSKAKIEYVGEFTGPPPAAAAPEKAAPPAPAAERAAAPAASDAAMSKGVAGLK